MIRVGECRLNFEDVAQEHVALRVAIAHHAKRFGAGCLPHPRNFHFLSRLEHPAILMRDIDANLRLSLFEVEQRLLFAIALALKILSFSSPIENVPRHLKAGAAETVGEHIAKIRRFERVEGETYVGNALSAFESSVQFRFP